MSHRLRVTSRNCHGLILWQITSRTLRGILAEQVTNLLFNSLAFAVEKPNLESRESHVTSYACHAVCAKPTFSVKQPNLESREAMEPPGTNSRKMFSALSSLAVPR